MFYGRKNELEILKEALGSSRAELGIVYGRRRVGKSTLLQKVMKNKGDLFFEGLQKASTKKQIAHFTRQLAKQTGSLQVIAHDWSDAFDALTTHIVRGKHFVVLDELPWMAAGRSELVSLLKFYWDNKWKKNPKLTMVLCGSIASFMVRHVVHSKALHNRKTFEIKLAPLCASEAKLFFRDLRSDYETLKFLMLFGGIPKYLEQIDPTLSLSQNVDKLCFRKNSFFLQEFESIFKEQFKVSKKYGDIVSILIKKGLSREEIAQRLGKKTSGGFSTYLDNLEQADFIRSFVPQDIFGKGQGSKTRKYYLWDEWLRFYFNFMEPHLKIIRENTKPGLFNSIVERRIDTYCGLSFERFCMKNITSVISAIDIPLSDVLYFGPFFRQPSRGAQSSEKGLQIDILLYRKGNILTVIECKFGTSPVGVKVIEEVSRKIKLLKAPRHYTIERVLISAGNVTSDLENKGYFHKIFGLENLI